MDSERIMRNLNFPGCDSRAPSFNDFWIAAANRVDNAAAAVTGEAVARSSKPKRGTGMICFQLHRVAIWKLAFRECVVPVRWIIVRRAKRPARNL